MNKKIQPQALNTLCIIIPVYNEQENIEKNINELLILNKKADLYFINCESTDKTEELLRNHHLNIFNCPYKSRGAQICVGTENTPQQCGKILILHIDTKLPDNFSQQINDAFKHHEWGFFKASLDSNKRIFKLIQAMMNIRSQVTSIGTGDQAMFVKKSTLLQYTEKLSEHPLMEDIYLSKMLKKNHGRAHIINQPVITSTRYWTKHGIVKSIIKMWMFRLLYFLGMSPKKLYRLYYQ